MRYPLAGYLFGTFLDGRFVQYSLAEAKRLKPDNSPRRKQEIILKALIKIAGAQLAF
jgi:hypothetical protein